MGYIGPVQPYQYQEYHKRVLSQVERHVWTPVSNIEKISLNSPFQEILRRSHSKEQQIIKKKVKRDKRARQFVHINEYEQKNKGRYFNEYV
ncbi:hypothetical protein [Lederbergia galactosidilytica]|uniref:Uncharacterized protein n=1 Tax=Lederbergia galactosidilytica TaxID=217031 RepID=A0A0Q9XRP8_9BACI|nr:hypothetical protein [Lederbergia galactosidilytica]KRG10879.1 hypothetical protein ACA29_19710 [Lederbergia galactosidilytica]KRG15978.1 hypothetical protein ACA30_03640 [Virgibacillus soli]OAK67709.1 hypothetical protein ABB05_18545 [Lederbergia galactosidilytica]